MGKLRKFPINYDEEYDEDIHRLIMSTPLRRRSERLRQLIRAGMQAERPETPEHRVTDTPDPPSAMENTKNLRNADYTP